jgi:hypothetical protein
MPDGGEPPDARPPRRLLPAWLEQLAGERMARRRTPRPPAPRRRRWLRWLVVLLVIVVLLYAALPYIAIGTAQRWLPLDAGDGAVIEELSASPSADPVNLAVYVRPGRARHLVEDAMPRAWLPPWLLRRGQCAGGTAAMVTTLGVMKLSWRLVISGGEPRPTVVVRLTTPQAAALLEPYTDVDFGGAKVACAIDTAKLTLEDRVDGAAPEWLLRVEARGRLRFVIGESVSDVPISRLVTHLRLRFTRVAQGWTVAPAFTLDLLESDAADAPMISAPSTRRQLEGVVNSELRRHLGEQILPPWFPTDAAISGEISPEALKP